MAISDFLCVALIAATFLIDHFWVWPRFLRSAQTQGRGARIVLWRTWMGMLWALSLTVIGLWIYYGRHWDLLGLRAPHDWRLWVSAALVLAVVALYVPSIVKLINIAPTRKAALRARFGEYAAMLPHSGAELAWFTAASLTAGFCEELLFRGYLVWVFQPFTGIWGAAAASCAIFGLAHSYQGAGGVLKTGLMGIVFMALVLTLDSLLTAIAIHALIDMAQGLVAWLVLREGPLESAADGGATEQ